jgi:hypothetical protein
MSVTNLRLNYISGFLGAFLLCYMVSCHKTPVQHESIYENQPTITALEPQSIDETSGIADSKINRDFLWVQEDSGNPPQLFLVNHDGKVKKTVFLKGIANRDWEDMTLAGGPDPSLDYLYVADIGDNGLVHTDYTIYRFPEPSLTVDTVRNIDKIKFIYPDGAHDAEAFIVDAQYGEIYIITKRDTASRIYKIKNRNETSAQTADYVTSLKFNGVVSAALSPDRTAMLVKTYADLYHFSVDPGKSLAETFNSKPTSVTYQVEPQGEAIAFNVDNTGFYTLSEKGFASTVRLFFYRKK